MTEMIIQRSPFKYKKNGNFITASAYHQYTKRLIIIDVIKSKGVFKYRQYFVYKNTIILLYESDYIDIVLQYGESYKHMIDRLIVDLMVNSVMDHKNNDEILPVIRIEDFDLFTHEAVH